MTTALYIIAFTLLVVGWIALTIKKKVKGFQNSQFARLVSDYRYSVYKSPLNDTPRSLTLLFEGNEIDDLGYQIYIDHTDKLDKEDILIRNNDTQELMKIVRDSDSESMIGVNDPQRGHVGYLQFETVSNKAYRFHP